MPTYIVRTHLVSLGFINPVMLVLGTSFAYSRFVVEKFTVQWTPKFTLDLIHALIWTPFSFRFSYFGDELVNSMKEKM